ncbi:DUF6305 family protein [Aquibacillus sp. 3ASR75-11]|uniref:DUF6305 family protein n=1 Tax=Terrihalobacillus insolitus TaxID=2950438 RepID=A0A9X3WSJ1_9BACI|nr:DUF6305 family protein [Terrihalobacillus insolitus]MDC3412276.1 DUF6305 family protein [Terrihalobacillus insolitus]MDC3423031.1 DUF6305 family protein [Terrihalobacillus insolitus]
MNKYNVAIICLVVAFYLFFYPSLQLSSQHINVYPNLPAPLGKEPILFTSAGQAAENSILSNFANQLHLEGDYRPRALASDLYDYETLVIAIGYSQNGVLNTGRNFQKEQKRTITLLKEAKQRDMPILLVQIAGKNRGNQHTQELLLSSVPYASYFLGLKNMNKRTEMIEKISSNNIPYTLVSDLNDLKTPFNSFFR